MKFLIITKSKHLPPPEAAPGLLDAMVAWVNRYKASGKLEAVQALAGVQGGGCIANVNSLEELHAMMTEFPHWAFNETEVVPIVDPVEGLQRAKQAYQAMMAGGGGR